MDSIIFLIFFVPIIGASIVSYIVFINFKEKGSPNKWTNSIISFLLVGIILFFLMFIIGISTVSFDRGGGY